MSVSPKRPDRRYHNFPEGRISGLFHSFSPSLGFTLRVLDDHMQALQLNKPDVTAVPLGEVFFSFICVCVCESINAILYNHYECEEGIAICQK